MECFGQALQLEGNKTILKVNVEALQAEETHPPIWRYAKQVNKSMSLLGFAETSSWIEPVNVSAESIC